MSNPTSNFNWQMPTATDLVTDLPADFEVFGQAVDTSLADLKGGTAGQILAKNTNTDMDFVWITNDVGDITAVTAGTGISGGGTSGAVTITNDMATTITTNGDLLYGTGAGTYTRRGIGSTGNVLTVSGGVPVWAAPAGGGKVLQVVFASTSSQTTITTTTLTDSGLSASITPTLSTSKVLVLASSNNRHYKLSNIQGQNMALLRDSTTIWSGTSVAYSQMSSAHSIATHTTPVVYLDSPATTSATTYKIQVAPQSTADSGNVTTNETGTSTMILLEIGA